MQYPFVLVQDLCEERRDPCQHRGHENGTEEAVQYHALPICAERLEHEHNSKRTEDKRAQHHGIEEPFPLYELRYFPAAFLVYIPFHPRDMSEPVYQQDQDDCKDEVSHTGHDRYGDEGQAELQTERDCHPPAGERIQGCQNDRKPFIKGCHKQYCRV